jgi:AcrR family transcriptional regulator
MGVPADKGEATRTRILDTAVRLASREGLEGLSIGLLASALGMSKSGIFAHFGSKDALQVATLEHAAGLVQARSAGLARFPPGPERLRALLEVIQDWVDDPELPGGCPITGACIEFDDQEGPVRAALERLQRATQQRAAELFAAFAHPSRDRDQLAFQFRSICLGYHHAARMLREPRARAWARGALEALIDQARRPADPA